MIGSAYGANRENPRFYRYPFPSVCAIRLTRGTDMIGREPGTGSGEEPRFSLGSWIAAPAGVRLLYHATEPPRILRRGHGIASQR
jgi:hypothetical protein